MTKVFCNDSSCQSYNEEDGTCLKDPLYVDTCGDFEQFEEEDQD